MTAVLPITDWYLHHKRDLPWRDTTDPYLIWLSEVILQQTRVEQGLPYFYKFTEAYKNIGELAAAKDDDVMKLWQGLGYYSRAVNMLNTARLIVSGYQGKFPGSYDELITLKGIGPYTAAAIASFSFNEAKAVLDGNVYRVLARVFEISEPVNSTKGKKIFTELAGEVLDRLQPALFNQAMMEIGAMVCKPRQPLCGECPLRLKCGAYRHKTIDRYPVKLKKNPPRDRFLHFFFVSQEGKTWISQRTAKGIWHKLYEPPFLETSGPAERNEWERSGELDQLLGGKPFRIRHVFGTKHQLTHQTIFAEFWEITPVKNKIKLPAPYIEVGFEALDSYAIHRLFEKFLNYHKLQESNP